MQTTIRSFTASAGWSAALPAELDSERTLVLAFADPALRDHPAFGELAAAFPQAHKLGCSTSGEIHADEVLDNSVVVAILKLDHGSIRVAVAGIEQADDSQAAGAALAQALTGPELKAVFVLSDGLNVNGTPLVRALAGGLGAGVQVSGGLAGDGARFASTWTWDGASAADGRVLAVGLYGASVQVRCASQGGWDVFGPERRVTEATGNVLHSLDGKPALELYKAYLGERAAELPASALLFPLAVRQPDGGRLVRTVLSVDEATQTMTFAGDIPTGALVQLMRANLDRLVDGAAQAGLDADAQGQAGAGPAGLAVAVSCVGRRLVLGERVDDEVEATLEQLPKGTVQVGFYSYGELGPQGQTTCELHNQTMTLTYIQETTEPPHGTPTP
jgi:hypothetical protein